MSQILWDWFGEKKQKLFKIFIENLEFQTIVGILPQERITPQKVCINAEITYLYEKEQFVDYAKVCTLIETLFQTKKYLLLEDALEDICNNIYKKYSQIKSIKLKIMKPEILANAQVGVEIFKNY